jgi:uroporphyrinogen-III synthase
MMQKDIRILSTKKLLQNQKQFLLNAGFSVIEADFIEIEFTSPTLENIKDNLIFTSSNAVQSILQNQHAGLISNNCFCVGQKTMELLKSNGFQVKESAANASELAKIIAEQYANQSFTFFTGNMTLEMLPKILKAANVTFNELEVYQTKLSPRHIKPTANGILFFSPSGVESFLKENKINNETCFCIGATTAKALENFTDNIIIANQPTVENTIVQTINYFKKA